MSLLDQESRGESSLLPIEHNKPQGETHPAANQSTLEQVERSMEGKQDMLSLADYIRETGKQRGPNPHYEQYIINQDGQIKVTSLFDLQNQLGELGVPLQLLGVQSIGNEKQMVEARVQGIDRTKDGSGFERPTVKEGPHMILAPYAVDNDGNLHIFRTIQYRTGHAAIDTPRGFIQTTKDETGETKVDIDTQQTAVETNMKRILKEETGERFLKMESIVYLGAPRVNGSFVESQSPMFAVKVDYDTFAQSNKVITPEEYERQKEQLVHEGLTNIVLDMTQEQYLNYRQDSQMNRDITADWGSDTVAMDFLAHRLEVANQIATERQQIIKTFTQAFKEMKRLNPQVYREAWENTMKSMHIKS